jgi:hypothetical protein
MAYKSDAQRKKFQALLAEGKIDQATYDQFEKASEGVRLPERVKPKEKAQANRIGKIKTIKVLK